MIDVWSAISNSSVTFPRSNFAMIVGPYDRYDQRCNVFTFFVLEIFPSRATLSVFVILKRECSLKRFVCRQLHWYSGACIVKFSERTQQHAWHIVRGRATLRDRELPCLYVFSMCVHVYVHGVRKHGGREHFAKVYQRFRGTHFNRKRLHFPEQRPE